MSSKKREEMNDWNKVYDNRKNKNAKEEKDRPPEKATQTFRRKPFDVLGYIQDKYGIEKEKSSE